MGNTDDQILKLLNDGSSLTLNEISEKLNKKPKVTFRSLRKLFENGTIDCDPRTRRYILSKQK